MCGICGIFDLEGNPVDQHLIHKMKAVIVHRGPDGQGEFFDREVGLGHCRLSIIDVAGGGQPLVNEDCKIQVVFNGMIYNFIELRLELKKYGHEFKTDTDTEVIVHAYEQWGQACVNRFNGMFAFALWDVSKRQLFLARDHLGIKPLYYTIIGSQFLFASEIKALLQHTECPREVDIDALAQLFTFRYVPSPKTLFNKIAKLPPAHTLEVSRSGIRINRFWGGSPKLREQFNIIDLIEEYQHLLEDAVKLQMRSHVPLGLFLSSGVDSAMLLAIMNEHASKPVQSFTIGFEGGENTNEVEDAEVMAKMFGADHYHQILGSDDYLKYYERYMWDLEEPVGNETAAAFYFVSQLTSQHVKVALTGQGADEIWAGYDRYKGIKLSSLYSRLPKLITKNLASLVPLLPGRMEQLKRGLLSLYETDVLLRFTKVYSFFSADMKEQLYTGSLKQAFMQDPYATRHALSHLHQNVGHLDALTQMLYMDTRSNLPDDLLMVEDKMSMANSLEVRVPFLDYRLVEFVESLPPALKLKGFNGKYLHKKAAEKWLPKQIVYRKKKGFANPIEDWFRVSMRPFVEDCLLSSDAFVGRYFNQDTIRTMLLLDRTGKQQYRRQIYLLVSLELWHRTFMSNSGANSVLSLRF